MGARWMQQKVAKQRRERRAWARPFTVRASAGPVWANNAQVRDGSLDLNLETRVRNEAATRKPHVPSLADLHEQLPINEKYCINYVVLKNTPFHRCQLYFTGRMDKFVIRWIDWRRGIVRLSIAYPTAYRAKLSWLSDRTRWRKSFPLTKSSLQ
jgi:hypothetical protein